MDYDHPRLPPELEREVFETAALRHPRSIPRILCVCQRSNGWIEPFLYRVVHSTDEQCVASMARRTPEFISSAVRALCLTSGRTIWSATDIEATLGNCTNLTHLVLGSRYARRAHLPLLATMRLQRLAVCLHMLFGGRMRVDLTSTPTAFASITHLDLYDDFRTPRDAIFIPSLLSTAAQIAALPALTHLRVFADLHPDVAQTFHDTARLEVIILIHLEAREQLEVWLLQSALRDDPRVVLASGVEGWEDWENGARGRVDQWARAEKLIKARHVGSEPRTAWWLP
ncbi:hypothetical protein MKEN_00209600 [Mycena kentingensis (nom. inval.)]|nr:hypothetical protein MKEN_00209600 [Mycena kentingensis (nom. inval.)]